MKRKERGEGEERIGSQDDGRAGGYTRIITQQEADDRRLAAEREARVTKENRERRN